ncbi:MAG: hypothetical protein JKX75_03625 [Gammaproteobacteria bacterium]|nr:hypothetical protein [Gammaproteobacteria bacterium]
MENKPSIKKEAVETDTKKLILVIFYMSLLVFVIFGLGPEGLDTTSTNNATSTNQGSNKNTTVQVKPHGYTS